MFILRPSIKKILFLVQRVAKIEASRAAAIFFFSTLFFFSMKILSIFGICWNFFFCKNEKKSFQPHLFEPPGRSTGNRIIFMDSLNVDENHDITSFYICIVLCMLSLN